MKLFTKTGRALVALVEAGSLSPDDGVPLGRLSGWCPVSPLSEAKLRKAVGRLVRAGLAEWVGDGEAAARITALGRAAVTACGPPKIGFDGEGRYRHLNDIPVNRLEADLNKAAAAGWRVASLGSYYAGSSHSREVFYWALLERIGPPA